MKPFLKTRWKKAMSLIRKYIRKIYYFLPRRLPFNYILPCRNAVVEITYRCNLNCQMCSFLREMEFKKDTIPKRIELSAQQFIEVVSAFSDGTNFAFTGGEPFVKKDFIKVVEVAKSKNCQVTIGTNGVLIDQTRAKILINLGVEQVCFSLDGPPDIHDHIRRKKGSFDSLFNNARQLRDMRDTLSSPYPRIMVNAVILPENHMVLPETMRLMKEMGADTASIEAIDGSFERSANRLNHSIDFTANPLTNVPQIPSEKLKKSLEKTFKAAEKLKLPLAVSPRGMTINDLVEYYGHHFIEKNWSCSIPWTTCRISPYGDLYPCLNYSIGNVLDIRPGKLWSSARYFKFREPFKTGYIQPACTGCCKSERR
jgi:MoaA/NifB/PqqE/SkfB family radical SAM enzyme